MSRRRPLGGVLAGGRGRRIGGGKAALEVGGIALADRAARLLATVAEPVVLLTDDAGLARRLGWPHEPDRGPAAGPLSGLEAALRRARELDRPGALILACDMPLVLPAVLELLVAGAERVPTAEPGPEAVLPESPGPLGVEPLCGYYASAALKAVRRCLDSEDRSMEALVGRLRVRRIPTSELKRLGRPRVLFHNVNTPEDRERAEVLLARRGSGRAGSAAAPSEAG